MSNQPLEPWFKSLWFFVRSICSIRGWTDLSAIKHWTVAAIAVVQRRDNLYRLQAIADSSQVLSTLRLLRLLLRTLIDGRCYFLD